MYVLIFNDPKIRKWPNKRNDHEIILVKKRTKEGVSQLSQYWLSLTWEFVILSWLHLYYYNRKSVLASNKIKNGLSPRAFQLHWLSCILPLLFHSSLFYWIAWPTNDGNMTTNMIEGLTIHFFVEVARVWGQNLTI